MATPDVVASYTLDGETYKIVWVGIGKYEVWKGRNVVIKDLTHREIIRYLSSMI